jgi:hypothetical protein
VARCTIGDIPRGARVIQLVGIAVEVVDRGVALIRMYMARQHQVHVVLEEERLEHLAALLADRAAPVGGADVPGTVTGYRVVNDGNNDPTSEVTYQQ